MVQTCRSPWTPPASNACAQRTLRLCAPLSPEDAQLQSMPDASPAKWHLAHTTWFFETFVLAPLGVAPVAPAYAFLFNSYYEAAGPRARAIAAGWCRGRRSRRCANSARKSIAACSARSSRGASIRASWSSASSTSSSIKSYPDRHQACARHATDAAGVSTRPAARTSSRRAAVVRAPRRRAHRDSVPARTASRSTTSVRATACSSSRSSSRRGR